MRIALCVAALLVALPLAAEEKKATEVKKSGCQVGEKVPKFSVVPVTGRHAKKASICYI